MSPVTVRTVDTPADVRAAADLLAPVRAVPVGLLHELASTGSPVTIAVDGDRAVGACAGFLTATGLHAHVVAVAEDRRRRGVGTALLWHLREWVLAAGIGTITWTFEPSDVAAARLSVRTLGAEITSYRRDFGADGQDRLVATWALRSARVTQAWHGVRRAEAPAERSCPPGAQLADALEAGGHVVDVADDGAYLVGGPG